MSADFTATTPTSVTTQAPSAATAALTQAAKATQALAGFFGALVTQYRVSRDIRELKALSDATLRDIGVSRCEIAALVHRQAFDGVDGRDGQQ